MYIILWKGVQEKSKHFRHQPKNMGMVNARLKRLGLNHLCDAALWLGKLWRFTIAALACDIKVIYL